MGVKQKVYSQQNPMLNILDDRKFKIYPLSFKFNVKIYVFQKSRNLYMQVYVKPSLDLSPHLNKSKYC